MVPAFSITWLKVCREPMSTWNHCPVWAAALLHRVVALPSMALAGTFVLPVLDAVATHPVVASVVL
ncbi:MAG: hypothetical protein ABJA82_02945 [Myxococcales bacterium]